MTQPKTTPTDYNQYGLRDPNAQVTDVYANRPGGEQPAFGPADAVDASGHRQGDIAPDPGGHASSRSGRVAAGEAGPAGSAAGASTGSNKAE